MSDESPPDADDDRDPVELLAAEFVDRHRRGESPSLLDYTRDHPDLADEIREVFPVIARLERLKLNRERSSDGSATAGLPRVMQLGSFRLIRELGRGGMGIVYEAEDQNLKRRVAVKVLGANIAESDVQLQRFRHEAESAARLHHTNIVPVFGTGEAHGVRFYVMQFIDGMPLSSLIEKLRESKSGAVHATEPDAEMVSPFAPLADRAWRDWKSLARKSFDLADALAYAHGQGVLHRDVKPANVLVDRDGHVWIADFGLAKHGEQSGVTNTGDLVGTLRYMAPEQFHGEADARSDVYSLGLTLFELLTLQPAFAESQYAPLVRQKTTEPVPSPRSVNPAIPRDLETIILKACALEPAHRYPTAAELADDLRRYGEDRPIRARRTSWGERLWRWSRRNPQVAGLTGLAMLLLAAVAIVFAVGNQRTNRALEKAVDAADLARGERQRAEHNLQLAVTALDEIMTNVSERGIPQSLQVGIDGHEAPLQDVMVTEADAALLKSLLHFFDEFATDNRADLNLQTAAALQRIGAIQQRLGKLSEAETAFQQAVDIYTQLAAAAPDDSQLTISLAKVWNQMGTARGQAGRERASFEAHFAALQALESSPAANRTNEGQFQLAETLILLGTMGSRSGGGEMISGMGEDGGRGPERSGRRGRGGPPAGFPPFGERGTRGRQGEADDPAGRSGRGGQDGGPGTVPFGVHPDNGHGPPRFPGGDPFQRAVKILKGLLETDPDNATYQFALATSYRFQIRRQRPGPVMEGMTDVRLAAGESIAILRRLVGRSPDAPIYTYELANALCRAGYRIPSFESDVRGNFLIEAVELAGRLVAAHPHVSEYQALLATTERRLAEFEERQGQPDEAAQRYRRALGLQSQLAARYPSVSLYQIAYAQMLSEWAEMQSAHGQREEAQNSLHEAIRIAQRSAAIWGDDPIFRDFLESLHRKAKEPGAEPAVPVETKPPKPF